jgi:hypothetical protein
MKYLSCYEKVFNYYYFITYCAVGNFYCRKMDYIGYYHYNLAGCDCCSNYYMEVIKKR